MTGHDNSFIRAAMDATAMAYLNENPEIGTIQYTAVSVSGKVEWTKTLSNPHCCPHCGQHVVGHDAHDDFGSRAARSRVPPVDDDPPF